jgi:hypothetical protein
VVLAIEKDERVVDLWHRMLRLTTIPKPPLVRSKTDDVLVKLCSYSEHALTSGPLTVTTRMLRDWTFVHRRAIEAQPWAGPAVFYRHGDYRDAPDIEATWFIDPPYQFANRRGYREGSAGIDFKALAAWARSRRGQVIVCEQRGANWLPFRPFMDIASHRGALSRELIWMNSFEDQPTEEGRRAPSVTRPTR